MNTSPLPSGNPPSKGGGCFGAFFVILLVLTLVVVGGGIYGLRTVADKVIARFGQTSPNIYPEIVLTSEESQGLQKRVEEFEQALQNNLSGASLQLRGQELQFVLAHSEDPELKTLRDKFFVLIEGDRLRCSMSIPLGGILFKDHSGKYMNGSAELKFQNSPDGQVQLAMESVKLGTYEVPNSMIKADGINLMEIAGTEKKGMEALARFLKKVSKVEIASGTLSVTLR
jgi:hypothetical protein